METMEASWAKGCLLKIAKLILSVKKKKTGCGSFCCDNYMSGAKSTDNPLDSIKTPALQKNAQTMEIIIQAHINFEEEKATD